LQSHKKVKKVVRVNKHDNPAKILNSSSPSVRTNHTKVSKISGYRTNFTKISVPSDNKKDSTKSVKFGETSIDKQSHSNTKVLATK